MQKFWILLACSVLILNACGKKEEQKKAVTLNNSSEVTLQEPNVQDFSQEPENFINKYNGFSDVQKYYFCAAFSMGAMSVSKPATASAMVGYFLGLGVVKYDRGIDDETYLAFDLGKNVFRNELVVNYILDSKICENVMIDAADYAKKKKYSTEFLSDKGHIEAEKIVDYIKK